MISARSWVWGPAGLVALALLVQPLAQGQEVRGQLKIGLHKVKLEQNKLYKISIAGPPQLNVDCLEGGLRRVLAPNPNNDKMFFFPKRTDEYTFAVTFGGFFGGSGQQAKNDTIDYTLRFNAVELAEQPVLKQADKLTDMDPIYKNQNKHFKAYPIQMNAGQTFIIDLVKDGVRDPYLYLEDPKGQSVASDDDGGGNLDSRIVYTATQNGQYTIIATTLGKETGGFVLTVQGSK